jgi:hypothetical protein
MGLLPASKAVTVIVEMVEPSAVTPVLGLAVAIELTALTAPTVKVTVAVCVIVTLSVVSVAVKTGEPAVVDFAVKVTTPEELELPEAAEIVSAAPRLEASVTVLPETGLPLASFSVTVIVEVVAPSAATVFGVADTVDCAAVTAPGFTVVIVVEPEAEPEVVVIVSLLPAVFGVTLGLLNTPAVNAAEVPVTPAVPPYVTVPVNTLGPLLHTLPPESSAVMLVRESAMPAVAEVMVAGAITNWLTKPGLTVSVVAVEMVV